MRIPAVLLALDRRRQRAVLPGCDDQLVSLSPFAITREGLTFGLISAGRVVVAFLALVTFLFTTLADDLLEALVARGASHRLAFVVLSAVQMVPADAGAGRLDPRRPAGARAAVAARSASASGRSFRSSGRSCSGSLIDVRERTFALEARGFGARPGRSAYRVVGDPPGDRWLRLAFMAAVVVVVVAALSGALGR